MIPENLAHLHGQIVGRMFDGSGFRAMERHRLRRCRALIDAAAPIDFSPLEEMVEDLERIAKKVARTARKYEALAAQGEEDRV